MGGETEVVPAKRPLRGSVKLPGDKSIGHRALLFNALAEGQATISGLPAGEDVRSTITALGRLGVAVTVLDSSKVTIEGRGLSLLPPQGPIDCGNSGTTMRLLMGILAAQGFASTLSGDTSLSARPMERVAAPLRAMGADIHTENGHAPVQISGCSLRARSHELVVASAQLKSALLLAGLQAQGRSVIREPLRSRDHSERLLRAMGVEVLSEGTTISLQGPARLCAVDVEVCGDPSSAAFLVVAATIVPGSEISLEGVCLNPTRSGFIDILRRMGADIRVESLGSVAGEEIGNLHVRAASLRAIEIAAEDVPAAIDELPVLAVAAACAEGRTLVTGAEELRVKESDRIASVTQMLRSLGLLVRERPDGFELEGGSLRGGVRVETNGDHRLVMSAAVAALACSEPVTVAEAAAVAVSFPGFFEVLEGLR